MRLLFILIGTTLIGLNSFSQTIPDTETIYTIQKKEKQQYDFSLQKGYTLKAIIKQMGIDLAISIYKKGDTARLGYFDSPNGENGPEKIQFEAKADGNYTLVLEPLAEDTALQGKYSIRKIWIKVLMATGDSSFADGSHIILNQPSVLQIENLTNLGRVWGFLKYYHPAVASGDYNWDASLFRILPKIISAKTKEAANNELEKWVDGIGKPKLCTTCGLQSDSSIQQMPDYGPLFSKGNLGQTLIEKLNYIKENRNQEENYYVVLDEYIGHPNFEHENPYKSMVYPDAGYRLLALFRYWNIIQYFFPYKYVIGEDWNKVLPEFIPKFVGAENATQYALACLEIITRIHDSHANIWRDNKELSAYFGKYIVPVRAGFIENKLVVAGHYTDTLSIQEKLKPGDIITAINGVTVEELVKKNLYITPGSNYETQLRDMPFFRLLRSHHDSLKLDCIRGEQKISCTVPCVEAGRRDYFSSTDFYPADGGYKIMDGNIAYLFPGKYYNQQLPDIQKAFAGTKGMIIDMRTYPSEFMPFTFGSYIKPGPSPFAKFTDGDVSFPGLFRYTPLIINGEINLLYYRGPIVELVNSTTQSQAEYTTMAFQTAPDITVIGSTTAGADGNVSGIYFPGGIFTMISGIGVFYPDGGETQRRGIRINKIVKPTIEGIKTGKDELMEEAIKIINSKTSGK